MTCVAWPKINSRLKSKIYATCQSKRVRVPRAWMKSTFRSLWRLWRGCAMVETVNNLAIVGLQHQRNQCAEQETNFPLWNTNSSFPMISLVQRNCLFLSSKHPKDRQLVDPKHATPCFFSIWCVSPCAGDVLWWGLQQKTKWQWSAPHGEWIGVLVGC